MAEIARLEAVITADISGLDKSLKTATDRVEGFADEAKDAAKSTDQLSSTMATLRSSIMANVVEPLAKVAGVIGEAFNTTTDLASDLNETITKTQQVFGASSRGVIAWAENSADRLGQTRSEALAAAAGFGNLFRTIGAGPEDAARLSKSLVELSTDIASFHNVKPEEAIVALSAAMRGESEPISRFGVLLNETTIKNEALKQGMIKTTKEALSPGEKAMAAYSLIMKQTSLAHGDFIRTANGAANQQRVFNAQLAEAKTRAGAFLLPIKELGLFITNNLLRAFNNLSPDVQRVIVIMGTAVGVVAGLAAGLLAVVAAWGAIAPVVTAAGAVLGTVAAFMTGPVGIAIAGVIAALAGLAIAYRTNLGGFRDFCKEVFSAVGRVLDNTLPYVWLFVEGSINAYKLLWEQLKRLYSSFKEAFNAIKGIVRGAYEHVVTTFSLLSQVLLSPSLPLGNMVSMFGEAADTVIRIIGSMVQGIASRMGPLSKMMGIDPEALKATVAGLQWGVGLSVDIARQKIEGLKKDVGDFFKNLAKPPHYKEPKAAGIVLPHLSGGDLGDTTGGTKKLTEAEKAAKRLAAAFEEMKTSILRDTAQLEVPLNWVGSKLKQGSKEAEVVFELQAGKLKGLNVDLAAYVLNIARGLDALKLWVDLTKNYTERAAEARKQTALGSDATEYQRAKYEFARQSLEGLTAEKTAFIKKQQEATLTAIREAEATEALGRIYRDLQLMNLPDWKREVIAAVGGMNVWKDLKPSEQEKAIRLFRELQKTIAGENARNAVADMKEETKRLGDSVLQASIQAAGGAKAWDRLTLAQQDNLKEAVRMKTVKEALVSLLDDYEKRARESGTPIKTAAAEAEAAIADLLKRTGALTKDPGLRLLIDGIRGKAKLIDANDIAKTVNEMRDSVTIPLLDLQAKLAGTYDPAKAAVRDWERQHREAIAKIESTVPDGSKIVEGFRKGVEDAVSATQKLSDQGRFRSYLTDLQKRFAELTAASPFDRFKASLLEFDEISGRLRMPFTEDQLKHLFEFQQKLDLISEFAGGMENTFRDAFEHIGEGFKGFFGRVIGGFTEMLQRMAAEFLASQIMNFLLKTLAGAFGATLPDVSGARAEGGPVTAGRSYIVGERRPEVFVPRTNGTILPNTGMAMAGAGGGDVHIHMTIVTPDAASFQASQGQIMAQGYRAAERHQRRNG